MKRLSAVLVLSACVSSAALAQAPGPSPGGKPAPGPGAAPVPGTGGPAEFVLMVCNKSKELAFAAVGSRIPQSGGGEHATRVQGWWQVPPGECSKIGTFPDPGFLIHLRSQRGITATFKERPSVPLCVNIKDAFTSTVASFKRDPKQCSAEQTSVMFQMFEVGQARTYTLTLNP
ncbi:MAG: DUF1036 domain-containing protein [Xanthobacteraceae bacterium]|nr:DUF1036 domain-containing protein [Xanthobacteraceae bacterium]